MRFDQLMKADPGAFNEAAHQIKGLGGDVQDHAADYQTQVHQQLKDTSKDGLWSGPAAKAAQVPMGDLLLALNRAADQLKAVPAILTAHADQLSELKSRLQGIVANAREAGIDVSGDGQVTVPADVVQRAKESGMPDPLKAVTEDIEGVLESAAKLDEQTAKALEKALAAESLNAHEVGAEYRDAVKDGNRAERLLKDLRNDMFDPAKRKELLKLLKEHADDPEFAKTLLNGLGGKGSMEALQWVTLLNGTMADVAGIDVPRSELGALQKSLGKVLALGTDPDSAFHVDMSKDSAWMRDFKQAGRSHLGGEGDDPFGYQILGAVLHSGKYSSEFLNAVGDDMLDMEHRNPDVFKNHNPLSTKHVDLNYIDDVGAGRDPINGLMMAMERNSEAATEFFDPANDKANGYSRIDQLLDRKEWGDNQFGVNEKASPHDVSQSLVIDALASATNGAEPGSVGYRIADETIDNLGEHRSGLHNDPARQSMGNLLAGQIHNVHEAMDASGNGFDEGALSRVLGDVAHSPEGYANVSNAERAYAVLEMEQAINAGGSADSVREKIENAATQMGQLTAHLDSGKADALEHSWQERENEYNRRVNAVGLLGGYALEKALGAIPGADLVAGQAVDELMNSARHDYSEYAEADMSRLYDKDRVFGVDMAEQLIWEHGLYETDSPPPKELLRNGNPIAFADMSQQQRDVYYDWVSDDSRYESGAQGTLNNIREAYVDAWVQARQSQRGGR